MLTDSQIERYSRQIVLPEVGGGGQERLLAARAAVAGRGEAVLFCAAYLAAAGVGGLRLDGVNAGAPLAAALSLLTRNTDCAIDFAPAEPSDVAILCGEVLPAGADSSGLLVWGCGSGDGVLAARFPKGRGCIECIAALASGKDAAGGSAQLLGSLLALLGLRALLGIGSNDPPELLRLAGDSPSLTTAPFPSRPGCPRCS
jgi:hypothetical protein